MNPEETFHLHAQQALRDRQELGRAADIIAEQFPCLGPEVPWVDTLEGLAVDPNFLASISNAGAFSSGGRDGRFLRIEIAVESARKVVTDVLRETASTSQLHQGRKTQDKTEFQRYRSGLGTSSDVIFKLLAFYNESLADRLAMGEFVVATIPLLHDLMKLSLDQLPELSELLWEPDLEIQDGQMRAVAGSPLSNLLARLPSRLDTIILEGGKKVGYYTNTEDQGSFRCPAYFTREQLYAQQFKLAAAAFEMTSAGYHGERSQLKAAYRLGQIFKAVDAIFKLGYYNQGELNLRGVARRMLRKNIVRIPDGAITEDMERDLGKIVSDFHIVGMGYLQYTYSRHHADNCYDIWYESAMPDSFYDWAQSELRENGLYSNRIKKLMAINSRYGKDLAGWARAFVIV